MPRLVLLNGAPGSGKSTIALALAERKPLDLALDIDQIKHSLGQWDADPTTAGLQARKLALALIGEHLGTGHDVYLGQFLIRADFIEELRDVAQHHGAAFFEVVLTVDEVTLAARLSHRRANPERPEHPTNARLVDPEDAGDLVHAISAMIVQRPSAIVIDASESAVATAEHVYRAIEND